MVKEKEFRVFSGKKIRRVWQEDQFYFSVVDVVGVLTDSSIPRRYWTDLKSKLIEEGSQVYEKIVQLKLRAEDGKMRETDCADTESIFRIIQSIPSKKAEPFKRWLAKVGSERIQEIENPELAQNRARGYYEAKGYPKDWIDKRIRGIAIRQNLTGEWKDRGIDENIGYAILTNEISQATFGKTVQEYKDLKKLDKENLRDHMGDWELILTMVGEKATTDITQKEDSLGFYECKDSAVKGGEIAGNTRKELEKSLGKSLISNENYLGKKERENDKLEEESEEEEVVEEEILVEVKNEK